MREVFAFPLGRLKGFHEAFFRFFSKKIEKISSQPESKKTSLFSIFSFFLGLGFTCSFYAANALFISHAGTQSLFYVYLASSILSLIGSALFYRLQQRYSLRSLFYSSFTLFGVLIFFCWGIVKFYPGWMGGYFIARISFYGIFVFTELQFWLIASHYFNNFEAKRKFPLLVSAGILGEILGGLFTGKFASSIGTVNLLLIWGIILIVTPPLTRKFRPSTRQTEAAMRFAQIDSQDAEELQKETSSKQRFLLPLLIFIFWFFYALFALSSDYLFNLQVVQAFQTEDQITSFFGKVASIASGVVLIYQMFFAAPLSLRFRLDRAIFLIPFLFFASATLCFFAPSLSSYAFAYGTIYLFSEYASIGLLHPLLNLFPSEKRAKVKVFSEGVGRPVGTLFFLIIMGVSIYWLKDHLLLPSLLFGLSILFLFYPFIFRIVYLRHLTSSLRLSDPHLISNVVQALGEKSNHVAAPALLSLLRNAEQIDLKRTIVISLGKIQSGEAFQEILKLFSSKKESLQLAAVQAVAEYKNYKSIFELFRLLRTRSGLSLKIRKSALLLLTQLVGKQMISFLIDSLEEADPRVQANAVESIGLLKDRKTISLLLPFLNHPHHRVRANTVIALHRFRKTRKLAEESLKELFGSDILVERLAAIYAIGVLKLRKFEKQLMLFLKSSQPLLVRQACIALARLENPQFFLPYMRLLLSSDEHFALESAYSLAQFPSYSRMLFFEELVRLNANQQRIIFSRLEKTDLDFSAEKNILLQEETIKMN